MTFLLWSCLGVASLLVFAALVGMLVEDGERD